MAYAYALYEKKDRIAYITINRPESMNALHPDASREMREMFEDFRDDPLMINYPAEILFFFYSP